MSETRKRSVETRGRTPAIGLNSFPRSAWECHPRRSASASPGAASIGTSSHIERRLRRATRALAIGLALACFAAGPIGSSQAQPPETRVGDLVPRDVRDIYDRGLQFLAASQTEEGTWTGAGGDPVPVMIRALEGAAREEGSWTGGGPQGPGVTGIALLALLASGEDPNYGIYSSHVRKALRSLIKAQNPNTGYFGLSMYHHGFAMLALAEAYGAVDERNLWPDELGPRTIGQALELAVRAAITAQKANPFNAWRYQPGAGDADTSVSGAVLIGLLASRNAGIEVPDEVIDKAIVYFRSLTARSGEVAYVMIGDGIAPSLARISIATLAFAVAHRKNLLEYKTTLGYLKQRLFEPPGTYLEYTLYYEAQALFQADFESWERWNQLLIQHLKQAQMPDGSIKGRFSPATSTSLSLLSLALNYRFLPIYER
jgi:hypothetical protein